MPRLPTLAAAVLLAGGAGVAVAAPQPPPSTTTSPTTTPPPPASTAPAAPAAPVQLSSLRVPAAVTAQQGHARLLVGVKLSGPAKLTIQILSAPGTVVRTATDAAARPAGRAYARLEAVDSRGYQLLGGVYTVRVQATGAGGRASATLQRKVTLTLTAPHGQLDAYTTPVVAAYRAQLGGVAGGQLVAVVAPKGVLGTAGVRRGDVITRVGATDVSAPGAWGVAMRALAAGTPVTLDVSRAGASRTVTVTPKPDWEPVPDYAKALAVAVRRDRANPAFAVAQVRQLLEAGRTAQATKLWKAWAPALRASAPGQLVQGDLLAKGGKWKAALGAYNRARKADPALAAAEFSRGLALSSLKRPDRASAAFAAAARLDPTDPAAQGFAAYALLQLNRNPDALAAATRAVIIDPNYADGQIPYGIALIAGGDRVTGVKALKRGVLLLDDAERAARIIRDNLDPADP